MPSARKAVPGRRTFSPATSANHGNKGLDVRQSSQLQVPRRYNGNTVVLICWSQCGSFLFDVEQEGEEGGWGRICKIKNKKNQNLLYCIPEIQSLLYLPGCNVGKSTKKGTHSLSCSKPEGTRHPRCCTWGHV